ncbi:MAG: hypothetical protein IPF83_00845 [Rhodanobacteraceae bacterium]|nr:hypothetical protein [Rhodanobacteraceae bacterium]MBK7042965.1 hypothetical protein [Rhodanobacteraceae bacterium]MBP9155287.1 hypothetical protein [Xanthomonadales bacterium]HQW81049.1 hypothetical protein [Pseudomonadota bacterium]
MEFRISYSGASPDLAAIESALCSVDPAANVDLHAVSSTLRVAGAFSAAELPALLNQAGLAVDSQNVKQLPSVCCGGCGG